MELRYDVPEPRAHLALPTMAVGENARYRLEKRIGRGAFGFVFKGKDYGKRHTRNVAVKLEPIGVDRPQLEYEYRVYQTLSNDGSPWMPKIYWFGQSGDYRALVMELLGPSLASLWESKRLPLEYVVRMAPKMLHRIEHCHRNGIVHRDIKLENFVVSLHDVEQIYLIDYGLSKSFLQRGEHIRFKEGKQFVGTARYCSLSAHLGHEQSRRDDLESLAYVLIYFCRGSLPWQHCNGDKNQRSKQIYTMKKHTQPEELCKGLPSGFKRLLAYARHLDFEEEPDYDWCRELFA